MNSFWHLCLLRPSLAARRRSPALTLPAGNVTVQCSSAATPGTFSTATCSSGSAVVGGFLQVCATYTYTSALTPLLPIPPVNMGECSRIAIH